MSWNRDADLSSCHLLNLVCQFIGNGRIFVVFHFFFIFLLGKLCILFGDSTLGYRDDGKTAAFFVPVFDLLDHLIDIIRNLGNQNDIRTAGHACIQGKPSYLMSHHFHDKYSAVGSSCSMDAVDGICSNIHCTVETECHIRSPDIIINGLRKMDDV